MNINIEVSSLENTDYEFAKVTLNYKGENYTLDLDFSTLYKFCKVPSTIVMDFLFLSSVIYSIDKIVPRDNAQDNWTRNLKLDIPVSSLEKWNNIKDDFQEMISFLTGDNWNIGFKQLQTSLARTTFPEYLKMFDGELKAVSLFSGGLDSLTGIINWLEENEGDLLLVGHYDPQVGGPKNDQKTLYSQIDSYYDGRTNLLQVKIGQKPSPPESTYRSRSLLFIALGVYAANFIGDEIPLLVPENGTIALNVPLTPSRRGACSTRTTHPYFLKMVRKVISKLGINNPIVNPFQFLTKGECLSQCSNKQLLKQVALDSVSCGKRGHRRDWIRKTAKGCGRCVPCIFRRASLHKINLDIESYGLDFCNGEVDINNSDETGSNDFRACISFLNKNYSLTQIKKILSKSGGIELENLDSYSRVVYTAMEEVRKLLQDKAIDKIKNEVSLKD